MSLPAGKPPRASSHSPDHQFADGKVQAGRLADSLPAARRLQYARAFCSRMVCAYWQARCRQVQCHWLPSPGPFPDDLQAGRQDPVAPSVLPLAASLGELAAGFEPIRAGYLLGTVYTALLPSDIRASYGAYYTPPAYAARLLAQVERAGFDWRRGCILDPACGGGAFLAPIARRIRQSIPEASPAEFLEQLAARLRGMELDPFAGWMAHVLLEAALLDLCLAAGRRLPNLVGIGDALALPDNDQFDLVIGNPPYGRIRLDAARRTQYARSLHGHANLYGLFTDLAVRLAKPGGIIGYVSPTSFLGGRYFQSLRQLLASQAPPRFMDFIFGRDGVFDNVLQEAMLAVYRKQSGNTAVIVAELRPDPAGPAPVSVVPVGRFLLVSDPGDGRPWMVPRQAGQTRFYRRLQTLQTRLVDLGYTVHTGPLVWNRHKPQFCAAAEGVATDLYPVIWAEAVSANGFAFRYARRNHAPFIRVPAAQQHLLTTSQCVLVQRTTAKEQDRRLMAAVLPSAFLLQHRAAVVENHLNILRPSGSPTIQPQTLAFVLNSRAADCAFRCISGSVAVSAYELNALPLPNLSALQDIDRLLTAANHRGAAAVLNRVYGLHG